MALKLPVRFPIFAPPVNPNPNFNPDHRLWSLEVRCSRWNNASTENFNQQRGTQKDIEDDIHRERQLDSASKRVNVNDNETSSTITNTVEQGTETFRTTGITSSTSKPSVPVKKSKHSKDLCTDSEIHPAFKFSNLAVHKKKPKFKDRPVTESAKISLSKDGVSYVIDGAPFEFKYSYTETPKVEPLKLREPPFVPFGPTTMPRPWTGRAPLPPSKKKLKEFDSFVLPPPHKKGVKPVQAPGPFLPGSGPKYVNSREKILGEPLTVEEIAELVKSCIKTKRQMNIGRDGLTHNMLDNIHAHWKRRRVCKIKCKGVCTVDMDNVCRQLEERTGGKIIHRRGGTVYLFRGRNYNYKTRPHFPLMLWKPAPPVYPRLIQKVPEGLTLEAATEMREKGRKLIPICKLGKNGVYCGLVKTMREAFEECELVRINCQGMNSSDFRKIGAKLRDLVPCVLLSFEREHILMWRGQNLQSSILSPSYDSGEVRKVSVAGQTSGTLTHEGQAMSAKTEKLIKNEISDAGYPDEYTKAMHFKENGKPFVNLASDSTLNVGTDISDISCLSSEGPFGKESESSSVGSTGNYDKGHSEAIDTTYANAITMDENGFSNECADVITESNTVSQIVGSPTSKAESSTLSSSAHEKLTNVVRALSITQPLEVSVSCTEAVISLVKKAVDEGRALVLDDNSLDADIVFQKAVSFSKSAPPGLTFSQKRKKLVQKTEKIEDNEPENKEVKIIPSNKDSQKTSNRRRSKYFDERYMNVVPQGSLRIDELAKLLG